MKVNEIVKTTVEREIEIIGATLLSIEDLDYLSLEDELCFADSWWLRSPSYDSDVAIYFYYRDDDFPDYGNSKVDRCHCVRPALKIKNIESSNMSVGDVFELGGYEFKIVSENLAWMYKQCIGSSSFNRSRSDKIQSAIKTSFLPDNTVEESMKLIECINELITLPNNDYETSDIKNEVDTWYNRLVSRACE